jgi:hypothetical protein
MPGRGVRPCASAPTAELLGIEHSNNDLAAAVQVLVDTIEDASHLKDAALGGRQ